MNQLPDTSNQLSLPLALKRSEPAIADAGASREIEAALKPFGEAIGPAIGQRAAFVDAFTAGQWIGQHAPNSKANTETAALAAAIARRLPQ